MLNAASYEKGFSLIELVVAMAVLSVVIGIFAMLLQNSLLHSSNNRANAISGASVTEALDRIGDDVRATRSRFREDIKIISTRTDLLDKFTEDPEKYGDIAFASGKKLAIWSNSEFDTGGPRCITYSVENTSSSGVSQWALVRKSSDAGSGCPSPASSPSETLVSLGENPPSRSVFKYGVLIQTGPATCRHDVIDPNPSSLPAIDRLKIVDVVVDLVGDTPHRGKTRSVNSRSTYDFSARLNDDYYFAIGCAE